MAEYPWSRIRYSISWKAYCFKDIPARDIWQQHADDLSIEQAIAILEDELRRRGVLEGARPDPDAFAGMMVKTFVRYPGA